MRNQVILFFIAFAISCSISAQPFYLRGAQDPAGPCDWNNTNAACQLIDQGAGIYTVTATTSNGIWKIYDDATGNFYPSGFGNAPWVESGVPATFSFNINNGEVGVNDGQGYDICAPGELVAPNWVNTTAMRRNDGINGSSYCIDVPTAGTYSWKPTACGTWETFDVNTFVRYADSEGPPAWSVTTNNDNDVVCVYYDRITGNLTSSTVVLPVELGDFIAKVNGNRIDIGWQTFNEINNEFFTLERSANGRDFETLDIIKGAGTSTNRNAYAYIDKSPINGANYYRLQQEDYDGRVSLSKVIRVDFFNDENLFIYPNPAFDRINISSITIGSVTAIVSDLSGKLLIYQELGDLDYLDIRSLQAGMYTIKLINDNQQSILVDKFIKM